VLKPVPVARFVARLARQGFPGHAILLSLHAARFLLSPDRVGSLSSRMETHGSQLEQHLQFYPFCTEEKIVSKQTRLETVYWLRETEEDKARQCMADAQRHVVAAEDALSAAQARAAKDERRSDSAAHWSIVESAHTRALQEARQAERAVQSASDGLSKSRALYIGAHTRTEALRRAIDSRQAEATRAEALAEKKSMDEIAMLLRSSAA
jgi:flagellar biosynthesis chaperone FliJ